MTVCEYCICVQVTTSLRGAVMAKGGFTLKVGPGCERELGAGTWIWVDAPCARTGISRVFCTFSIQNVASMEDASALGAPAGAVRNAI